MLKNSGVAGFNGLTNVCRKCFRSYLNCVGIQRQPPQTSLNLSPCFDVMFVGCHIGYWIHDLIGDDARYARARSLQDDFFNRAF